MDGSAEKARKRAKTPSRARSKSPGVKASKDKEAKQAKRSRTPKAAANGTAAAAPNKDPLGPEERRRLDNRARLALAAAIALPWILFPAFGVSLDGFRESFFLDTKLHVESPLKLLLLVAVLSIPHVFYVWVWTNSQRWSALCHSRCLEPYKAFASTAHLIKGVQFAGIALWALPFIKDPVALVRNIHPLKAVLLAQLFGIGQLLNVEVYNKIGEAGVYYGTRLGVHVPWVYGFPFSVVPHPQYFGATLSFIGLFLFLANEATVAEGVYLLCVVIAVYYAFSSYTEANW